jgi:hypothetical protein
MVEQAIARIEYARQELAAMGKNEAEIQEHLKRVLSACSYADGKGCYILKELLPC